MEDVGAILARSFNQDARENRSPSPSRPLVPYRVFRAPDAMDPWKKALATMDAKDRRIFDSDYSSREKTLNSLLDQIRAMELASPGNQWRMHRGQLEGSIMHATEVTGLVMDDGLPWAWMIHLLKAAMKFQRLEWNILESLTLISDSILRSYHIRLALTNDQDGTLPDGLFMVFVTLYSAILEFAASSVRWLSGSASSKPTSPPASD